MINVYYAHHQWKYGTKIEDYELKLIRRYFPNANIFNPAGDLVSTKAYGEEIIMDECLKTVKDSDILVFSSVNGTIGTGVFNEVMKAQELGKTIFYVYHDELVIDFWLEERTDGRKHDRMFAFVDIFDKKGCIV